MGWILLSLSDSRERARAVWALSDKPLRETMSLGFLRKQMDETALGGLIVSGMVEKFQEENGEAGRGHLVELSRIFEKWLIDESENLEEAAWVGGWIVGAHRIESMSPSQTRAWLSEALRSELPGVIELDPIRSDLGEEQERVEWHRRWRQAQAIGQARELERASEPEAAKRKQERKAAL